MKQSVQVFDQQYLLQAAAELLSQKAEILKLKDLIRAAEASKHSRSVRTSPTAFER